MNADEIRNLTILELIAPDPYSDREPLIPTEEERSQVYERYKESKNWEYVFEPIKDTSIREKMIELYKQLDNE